MQGHILVVGDFNICQFQSEIDENETKDARLNKLLHVIDVAGLFSYNTIKNHQWKTLDLVLSNLQSIKVSEGSLLIHLPDEYHPPLEIELLPIPKYRRLNMACTVSSD